MASNLDKKVVTGDALVSILTQSVTSMNNKLNNRPCISIDPGTGHFIINEVDSGVKAVGEDGNSITKVELDSNNNVTVTFTDGTSQVIGTLNINIQTDLLTEEGFGNIRYYNGKFEYNDNGTWKTIVVTNNNLLLGISPSPMLKIRAKYNSELGKNVITMIPPNDTIIDNQIVCYVEKVIIRRKKDSMPTDINDGELALTLKRKDFERYQLIGYVDESCSAVEGDIWYYRAFPTSTLGLVNTLEDTNVCDTSGAIIYGFTIDQNESDPDSMITYIEDNADFIPAHMNYSTDSFDYGSWKDVWFIKGIKPCMLNYDGTVAYELDPNDYSKKITGEASDIADLNFEGNVMIGIPKVYWKIVDNEDNTASVYFSNKRVDNDYHCWSHLDENGNEIDYCYISPYLGISSNSRLRSMSGQNVTYKSTFENLFNLCNANNLDGSHIWSMLTYSDKLLIDLLLILISKTTNSQAAFGYGRSYGERNPKVDASVLNTNGLFYGTSDTWHGQKVFGIVHWWGNYSRTVNGIYIDKGVFKAKMTYSTLDGSTVAGYNTAGIGYLEPTKMLWSNSSGTYIRGMSFSNYGIFPTLGAGSDTTYYCDTMTLAGLSKQYICLFGGCCGDRTKMGIFSQDWSFLTTSTNTNGVNSTGGITTFLSCKPLVPSESNS